MGATLDRAMLRVEIQFNATRHFTDPQFAGASLALCERAEDAELGEGVHTFTTTRFRVTCPVCREWLHA
jgi:hypothetical protein